MSRHSMIALLLCSLALFAPVAFSARDLKQANLTGLEPCKYTELNMMMMDIDDELCPNDDFNMECPWRVHARTAESCKEFCDMLSSCNGYHFNGRQDFQGQRCKLTAGQYRLTKSSFGNSIGVKWPPPGGVCGQPGNLGPEFGESKPKGEEQSSGMGANSNPGRR